ncbi:hypothetical protein [Sphingomonas daechungensis]|uniref:hypothetical protein n=1 Tax=Sphingomonas daechungensis TaxID=1176646 RepID=UPI003784E51C
MNYEEAIEYIKKLATQLRKTYDEWEPLQTSADERAYDLLGRIYEEGAKIDADDERLQALMQRVALHPDVKGSKKWSAESKTSAELLVTLLLGLKEKRSRKHNWLCVLACAAEQQVAPTAAAFNEWIRSSDVGGIEGAIELYKGGRGETREARQDKAILDFEAPGGVSFEVPLPLSDEDELPYGYFLLLGRHADKQRGAEAITLLTDKRLIASACTTAMKEERKVIKQIAQAYQEEMGSADTDKHPANLRIPKHLRVFFDGRLHYTDEDERNEFLRELKADREYTRKRLGKYKPPLSQDELARKGKGKLKLPEEVLYPPEAEEASDETSGEVAEPTIIPEMPAPEPPSTPEEGAFEDKEDYFAELRVEDE